MLLSSLPRVPFAFTPTPLERAPRLSAALGGPRILIKRDDQTGLALGGNKARKLEFWLGEAISQGADAVITTGGVGSNHARMTAAAARRVGITPVLILSGQRSPLPQGNLLLDGLLGADIRYIEDDSDEAAAQAMAAAAAALREAGHRPYIIPGGGSGATGDAGYVAAFLEFLQQTIDQQLRVDRILVATGSCGTQAGLALGAKLTHAGLQVLGISVSRPADAVRQRVAAIATDCARSRLGVDLALTEAEVDVTDDYIGPGYGVPTEAGLAAMRLAAATEGLILDPVYTGKCLAGLIDLVRRGEIGKSETVVFWHTGGAPGIFAHAEALAGQTT
ncbi:MAG: D-cysteine desulfhydrase family protein [Symbiobacteriia bacterium]